MRLSSARAICSSASRSPSSSSMRLCGLRSAIGGPNLEGESSFWRPWRQGFVWATNPQNGGAYSTHPLNLGETGALHSQKADDHPPSLKKCSHSLFNPCVIAAHHLYCSAA